MPGETLSVRSSGSADKYRYGHAEQQMAFQMLISRYFNMISQQVCPDKLWIWRFCGHPLCPWQVFDRCQAHLSGDDSWWQLTCIPNHERSFTALQQWHERRRLGRLAGLVNCTEPEGLAFQPEISSPDASRCNHIGRAEHRICKPGFTEGIECICIW